MTWTVDFDANGTSYHYVVDAETGDLVDFSSFGLRLLHERGLMSMGGED
ncbi:MAG: PepSY domain-containing protein [Atopobiaceae bacterium]|nr:PepSY domain-containing protein [Atopobiaceae bacterium]